MEILTNLAKLQMTHVPYKGSAPMLTDLIAGQIDMAFDTTAAVVPYTSSGRLKALAIAGPQPIDLLPGVATIAQTFPGFDTDAWQGVFVPAGTPKEIVARLSAELVKAIRLPDVSKLIAERGFRPVGSTHEQFSAHVKAELRKYEKVIKENNIRLD
jgi:tripartite-type tricarboxylate transporter receptor subunit TctC